MSQTVHLPAWVEPMAHQHAENFCEAYFEGKSPDEKEFHGVYSKAFNQFCIEFYKHSLIPGVDEDGELNEDDEASVEQFLFASNPGQVVSRAAFEGSEKRDKAGHRTGIKKPHPMASYFLKFFEKTSKPSHHYDEIKASTNLAVEQYLSTALPNLNLDHGGSAKDSKDAVRTKLAKMTKADRKKFYREAVIGRYIRLFFAAYTVSMIKKVFETKATDIERFTRNLLRETDLKDLQSSAFTDKFAIAIQSAVEASLSNVDLVSVAGSTLEKLPWKSEVKKKEMSEETKTKLAEQKKKKEVTLTVADADETPTTSLGYEDVEDEKKAADQSRPAAPSKTKKGIKTTRQR